MLHCTKISRSFRSVNLWCTFLPFLLHPRSLFLLSLPIIVATMVLLLSNMILQEPLDATVPQVPQSAHLRPW